ncbi:MAG TPA: hypothetical protein PK536_01265 [Ignavibacteria bacterium]|nr:hypothetical protein [Bacteroidota bacterium]HRI84054.1 hypothetical protein [Ignavibacteria bacterium]HRK00381.1 hypothetical protein [Ignavibacteria bacterium]
MKITKKILAGKILDYLHHKITLPELVDWSENALMEGEFDEKDFELLGDITGRLGLADVRAFGLMWEDCEKYLNQLGYKVNIKAEAI